MSEDRPAISGLRKVQVSGATAPIGAGTGGGIAAAALNPQATALLAEATATASDLLAEIAGIEASIAVELDSQTARFRDELAAQAPRDRERRDTRLAAFETQLGNDALAAQALLTASTEALAPGASARAWSADWAQHASVSAPSSFQRFGTVTSPTTANGTAALAPLLNRSGWFLCGDVKVTIGQIQGALTRIVAQAPLKHLRVAVFDPKIEGQLGMFARLRAANASTFPPPMSGAEELRAELAKIVGLAAVNAEAISASGARDLGELWASNGMAQGEYTVLVVLNYPAGVDAETNKTLLRLAETGASRGISLIVQEDLAADPVDGVDSKALVRHLTALRVSGSKWTGSTLPASVEVSDDGAPSKTVVDAVVTSAISAASAQSGPELPLADFIDESLLWAESSIDSIDAVIGRAGPDPLVLSFRSENPPHPNVLLGGAVGQGKSTLLLDIIYSLASRYSPDDLELILLDFKRGLEFKRFDADETGKNWLPHVRVLSLESDRPFGLAVLDHVAAELARRSSVFKASGANSITEYRRSTGLPMSRMLLIIDEFQVLFDGGDQLTDDAVARLEELARQGRAFGIHLLLGTQSVSGISGLRVKGDTIFAQFPIRISLKNTAAESQALFSRENTAPAHLSYRGEVIVNRDYGQDPIGSNVRGIAAYGSQEYLRELQQKLWVNKPENERPMVFIGGRYAEWPVRLSPVVAPVRGSLDVWLGMPMEITDVPASVKFRRDVDQAVAIVGRGEEESAANVRAILATAIVNLAPGSRIVLLDGDGGEAALTPLLDEARSRKIAVEVIAAEAVSSFLVDTLRGQLAEPAADSPTLVVGLGLQKIADLVDETPENAEEEYGPMVSGASVLRQLATRGGTKSFFFVGSWANVRTLTEHLGYGHAGIGTYVLLTLGLEDLRAIVGPEATKVDGSPRLTVLDRGSDARERTVVPFVDVSPELLASWSNR